MERYSVSEFNRINSERLYLIINQNNKALNKLDCKNDYEYKNGINKTRTILVKANDISLCVNHTSNDEYWICEARILPHSDGVKWIPAGFLVRNVYLFSKQKLGDFFDENEDIWLDNLVGKSYMLKYKNTFTDNIYMHAIDVFPSCIWEIKEQTEKMCLYAIEKDPWALQLVRNPTEQMCLYAIEKDPWALQLVRNPTEQMCLRAVEKNGLVLQLVKNQTEEICKIAIAENPQAKAFVR